MQRTKQKEKTIVVDTRKILSILIVVAFCFLTVLAFLTFLSRYFEVDEFIIQGDSPYDPEDFAAASGIYYGDRLYSVDFETAEQNLLLNLPYLENVKIEKIFPNKIRFIVESYSAVWYIKLGTDCYALDLNLRVLEETADEQRFIKAKVPKLVLPSISYCVAGNELVFGKDDIERKVALEFIANLKSTAFMFRVSEANIKNIYNAYIVVDSAFEIRLGEVDTVMTKISLITTLIDTKRPEYCVGAEIDTSKPSNPSVKWIYNYPDPEEQDKTEDGGGE